MGPRALASRTLQRRLSSSQGGLSSLQLLTTSACPSSRGPPCLPPCPHVPVIHNLCHHASEAQEQVPCPCEIPLSQEAQTSASAAPKEECPSSHSSVPQGSPLNSSAAGDHQELQGAMAPSSLDAGPSCAGSDEFAQGPEEESAGASQAAPATQSPRKDPLPRKASMSVEFLLEI